MDQTRFVILLLSDSVDCTIRQELREKLLDVIDTRVYALAEYYDLSAKGPIPLNVVNVILVKTIKDEKVVQRVKEYFVRGGNVISFGEIELDELELKAENIKDLAIMISSRLGGCWISSTFECRAISKANLSALLATIRCPKIALKQSSSAASSDFSPGFDTPHRANLIGSAAEIDSLLAVVRKSPTKNLLTLDNLVLDFSVDDGSVESKSNIEELVKIEIASPKTFDWTKYDKLLETEHIGRPVIHAEITRSTMNFYDSTSFFKHGLLIIADRQANGKGRGGNTWLSPSGCAMFSLHLQCSSTHYLSILQHLAALAVVHSIRARPGYEDLDVRLKWPNDIYYGRLIKLGGVLVSCSFFQGKVMANIGLGINLDNEYPTTSLNKIVKEESKDLQEISREDLLASTFNELEKFLNVIEDRSGFNEIEKLYYRYWLHENQKVHVRTEDSFGEEESGIVRGIDQSGYLLVELNSTGKIESVMPGENSFDMIQGLILPKFPKKV